VIGFMMWFWVTYCSSNFIVEMVRDSSYCMGLLIYRVVVYYTLDYDTLVYVWKKLEPPCCIDMEFYTARARMELTQRMYELRFRSNKS
jgi:hypothetical protein